jgi:hypothetical protein
VRTDNTAWKANRAPTTEALRNPQTYENAAGQDNRNYRCG